MGPVEARARSALRPRQQLSTPTGAGSFTIAEIGSDGIVLLLGAKEARTRLRWSDVEGVVAFLKGRDWVPIGGTYDVSAAPGTLDSYFKRFVNRATAGWMAVVLEKSGIVELDRSRPARVRLKDGF